MIDRQARARLGVLLRGFLSGRLTNHAYDMPAEEAASNDIEVGPFEIWHMTWFLYDDFKIQRVGNEIILSAETRQTLMRCLLFLQHDFEF